MTDEVWRVLERRTILDRRPWYLIEEHKIELSDGRIIDGYARMLLRDYVIVVAVTPEREVLVERLYKHGVGHTTLDLVAGLLDDGEDPLTAAQRELMEETGCTSEDWQSLGDFAVNSNYGCGRMHAFLATNVRQVREPHSGDLERIELLRRPLADALNDLREGRFELLSAGAALALAHVHLSGIQPEGRIEPRDE